MKQTDLKIGYIEPGKVGAFGSLILPQGDGIEFIINVKKGTEAVNVSQNSTNAAEKELLLNAGTKFKLVKVFYNGCDGEEERILAGEQATGLRSVEDGQKVWKVYLETIPPTEEGELKKEEQKKEN